MALCGLLSPYWGGAPQLGCLDLLDRVQEAGQLHWPGILINSATTFSQKSYSKCQLVLQVLPWEMFPGTLISASPWTLECKINMIFLELTPICCCYSHVKRNLYKTSFFPHTARLWNSLSADCFPSEYKLHVF